MENQARDSMELNPVTLQTGYEEDVRKQSAHSFAVC
jgi:hypothetical protein